MQIGEFKFLEDRKRRLISQLLQRKCISEALLIPWSQIRIRKTKGKKPWVLCEGVEKDHAPNFNFNVSHEVTAQRSTHQDTRPDALQMRI
jgi:phosphopantetheinyl transferase